MPKGETHHMRTPEGLEIARTARSRYIAGLPDVRAPQIFVVRLAVDHRFGWEIRRYGSIVLGRSLDTYGSPMLAKTAGERALANMAAEAEVKA